MLKGLKSYKPSKYKCSDFLSKTHDTFLLWLITFEPLKQKQSYIPLLKVLMCCMNAWGAQWHGGIFILQFTSLKIVLLLHKTALDNFPMATTVYQRWDIYSWKTHSIKIQFAYPVFQKSSLQISYSLYPELFKSLQTR